MLPCNIINHLQHARHPPDSALSRQLPPAPPAERVRWFVIPPRSIGAIYNTLAPFRIVAKAITAEFRTGRFRPDFTAATDRVVGIFKVFIHVLRATDAKLRRLSAVANLAVSLLTLAVYRHYISSKLIRLSFTTAPTCIPKAAQRRIAQSAMLDIASPGYVPALRQR
jgi:hypothetical protein